MFRKLNDFYVGQRVKVRDWDDMVEEYGVDEVDDTGDHIYIDTPLYSEEMGYIRFCFATGMIITGIQQQLEE